MAMGSSSVCILIEAFQRTANIHNDYTYIATYINGIYLLARNVMNRYM